jgi:beta-galactosidase
MEYETVGGFSNHDKRSNDRNHDVEHWSKEGVSCGMACCLGICSYAMDKPNVVYILATEPMIHILPHWTHPKMEKGTKVPVWVYSNCDEVELFLNGKSLGKDKPGTKWDEMQCDWMVPWTPGKLEAVGYKGGKEIVRTSQTTADVPAKLALSVEGDSCPIITVVQQDKNGVMNPYAENRIHYHIDGPARILSLESGNPVNTENNYGKTSRTAFFGLARAFLQAESGDEPLSVVVGAICGEKQLMTSDQVSIDVQPLAIRGEGTAYDLKILYSTDGSKPSKRYTGVFSVESGSVVKADVFDGGKLLFSMEEKFGPDEGIHWPDESAAKAPVQNMGSGEQAEDAKFEGAKVSSKGEGFEGKGYLDFGNQEGAYVEWYQENDGSPGPATLAIRYSGKRPGKDGRSMKLTVNGKDKKLFFPNTGGYGTDWKTLEVKIRINSGANHIRLTTIENGGLCIDAIEVR